MRIWDEMRKTVFYLICQQHNVDNNAFDWYFVVFLCCVLNLKQYIYKQWKFGLSFLSAGRLEKAKTEIKFETNILLSFLLQMENEFISKWMTNKRQNAKVNKPKYWNFTQNFIASFVGVVCRFVMRRICHFFSVDVECVHIWFEWQAVSAVLLVCRCRRDFLCLTAIWDFTSK